MSDYNHKKIIEKSIEEHRYVDENLSTAENKMSDINALVALQRERSEIARSSLEDLQNRFKILQQHIENLHGFMLQHFKFEENTLTRIFDASFVEELLIEHNEIDAKFTLIKDTLSKIGYAEVDSKGLLEAQSKTVNMLNDLCYSIRQHAGKEDKILHELKARNKTG